MFTSVHLQHELLPTVECRSTMLTSVDIDEISIKRRNNKHEQVTSLRVVTASSDNGSITVWKVPSSSKNQSLITNKQETQVSVYKIRHGNESKTVVHDVSVSSNIANSNTALKTMKDVIIATAGSNGTIRINFPFAVHNNNKSCIWKAHGGAVKCVDFTKAETTVNSNKLLASCSNDKTVKIWCPTNRKVLGSMIGHSNWVNVCKFSKDSSLLVSGSDDKTAIVWDSEQCSEITRLNNSRGTMNNGVSSVAFHPTDSRIVSTFKDNFILLWDLRSDTVIQKYNMPITDKENSSSKIRATRTKKSSVSFHSSGNFVLTSASNDEYLRIWDVKQGHLLNKVGSDDTASRNVSGYMASMFYDDAIISASGDKISIWETDLDNESNYYTPLSTYQLDRHQAIGKLFERLECIQDSLKSIEGEEGTGTDTDTTCVPISTVSEIQSLEKSKSLSKLHNACSSVEEQQSHLSLSESSTNDHQKEYPQLPSNETYRSCNGTYSLRRNQKIQRKFECITRELCTFDERMQHTERIVETLLTREKYKNK